jgi:putative protease
MAAGKKAKATAKRKKGPAAKPAVRGKRAVVRKKVAKKPPARRRARKTPKPAARPTPAVKAKPVSAAAKPAVPRAKPASPPLPLANPAAAITPKAKPTSPPSPPAKPVATGAAPAAAPAAPPAAGEERIGAVSHYFSHLFVAALRMESGTLRVGDTIHVKGHTTDFTQRVESLQVDHASVPEVRAGQDFGVKVIDHAREHDVVYKVSAP